MRWQVIKKLNPEQFKRLVEVKPNTFSTMVAEAKRIGALEGKTQKGKRRGPKEKMHWYDKVLMLLMYYREYRTFAHIAATYNISEAQCCGIITTLEKCLIKSKLFHLPGKKKLNDSDTKWEIVVVDVSEHSIERPKKIEAVLLREKEKTYLKKPSSSV